VVPIVKPSSSAVGTTHRKTLDMIAFSVRSEK